MADTRVDDASVPTWMPEPDNVMPPGSHLLIRAEPQPIADQWMIECACGWRSAISVYEQPSRRDVMAEISRRYGAHVDAALAENPAHG